MKNIFLVGDTHFGHWTIVRHCNRPFSIENHDEALLERWNSVVKKGDTIFHLRDFAMIKEQADGTPRMKLYRKLRMKLNGKIILIRGNHDQMSNDVYRDCFSEVYDLKEISIDGERITVCHYPMRSWNDSFHGRKHIFGHVHGRLENIDTGVSCDVGVDVPEWNYTPVAWDILKIKLNKKYDIFCKKYKNSKDKLT